MHTCMHRRFWVQIRPANMSVVLLSEYAAGLADGSEFVVEDLAKNIKLTYYVWKGTAYVKTETPTSVRDFHDHDDFQKSADEHITWLRTQTKGEAVSKGRDEKSRKSGWAPSAEDIEVPAPPEDDPGVCEVCLRRFPGERFPFAMCRRCGDRPSWHHGRCCLWERRRTQTSANSSSTTIGCGPELGLKKRVTLGLFGNRDFWGVSSFRTLYSHF